MAANMAAGHWHRRHGAYNRQLEDENMAIRVEPLDAPLGARVTGVDLSQDVDADTIAAIYAAWMEHVVLVFPDQDFDEPEQIRFSENFGPLGGRSRPKEAVPEGDRVFPGVMLVTNIREDGEPIGSLPDGEMMFHSDGSYSETPYKFTFLFAIEVPSVGGNTLFSNMYRAYDTLPGDLKERLAGARALHSYYAGSVDRDDPIGELSSTKEYPLFIRHEDTAKTALFASRLMTMEIVGMDKAESDAVLEQLFDHSEKPEMIYEHVWSPGDMVMWDNRCSNHARTDFPGTERRLLRRTTVYGSVLTGVAEAV